MPTRKHSYITPISVTTSLARTKIGELGDLPPGIIRHIILHIVSISGMTAFTKITLGTMDADRRYLIPSSAGTIEIDAAVATKGTLAIDVDMSSVVDIPAVADVNLTGIWMGLLSGAGTCTVESVEVIVEQ